MLARALTCACVQLGTQRCFGPGRCQSNDPTDFYPHKAIALRVNDASNGVQVLTGGRLPLVQPESWDWGAGSFTRVAAECLSHVQPEMHTVTCAAGAAVSRPPSPSRRPSNHSPSSLSALL